MKFMKNAMLLGCLMPLVSLATTYYVNGTSGSDSNAGTSSAKAKKTIQSAINAASSNDHVLVAAGTYAEHLEISGKAIELRTIGILDVIVDGTQDGHCLKINSECGGTVIDGFVFYNGAPTNSGNRYGGGVDCSANATIKNCVFKYNGNTSQHFSGGLQVGADLVTVYNCLFYGNKCYACGGAVLCEGNGSFDRCTIYNNTCTGYNYVGGIGVASGGSATIKNSIVWGNSTVEVGAFSYAAGGTCTVTYSCVDGGYTGMGNISSTPSFSDTTSTFALSSSSPCINSGNPSDTDLDGSRADMGFSASLIERGPNISQQCVALDIDSEDYTLSSDGSTTWTIDTSTSYYGGSSLKSAAISHSGTTYTTLSVNGLGTVTFYWKVSSESNFDKLHCYLDGSEAVTAISGSTDWAQVTLTLATDSEHLIKWAYTKDGSVSSNSDCGWIDRVVVSLGDAAISGWSGFATDLSAWSASDNNVLLGIDASFSGTQFTESGRLYSSDSISRLSDGVIDTASSSFANTYGIENGTLTWTLEDAVDLCKLRINTHWCDGGRDGVNITSVEVKTSASDEWQTLENSTFSYGLNDSSSGSDLEFVYANSWGSVFAENVTAIRFNFGYQDNSGTGFTEFEAVCAPRGPFTCTQYNMNSAVSYLSTAKSYLEDSSKWASTPVTKRYQTLAFLDGGESTSTYDRVPFPGNSTTSDNQDDFVVVSTATIVIPSDGSWSFSCWSDDGFELTLTRGDTTFTSSYNSTRSYAYTTKSFDLTAGEYELKLIYFDRSEGATCMLFAAQGAYSAFDSSAFKLLGESGCPIGFAGDTPDNGYAVEFDANGGNGMMANQRFESGESKNLTANAFARSGYTFQGWATSVNGSVAYTDGASVCDLGGVGAKVTLYAKWLANTYQVTLSYDSSKINVIYGNAMPSITPPTRSGYKFFGYYTGSNGSGTQYYTSAGASARNWDVASNTTLYPYWVVNSYTVTFNANGGSGSMSDESFNMGETKTLTANAFTRTGYSFAGWAETANGAVKYADGASVSDLRTQDGATITLYAKWQGNTYQVSFSPLQQGLNVTYYDLSSAITGDAWQQHVATYAEASTYSSTLTSTIVTNSLDIGSTLDFGYVGTTSTKAKFHGKYATYGTEYFTVKLDGYYYVESAGTYTFKINHDDHCIVYIDRNDAYHYWGSMSRTDWTSFSVSLTAGYHEILVWFFENTGYQFLRFQGIEQTKLYRTDPTTGSEYAIAATYGEPMPPVSVPSRAGYTFAGYFTGANGSGTQYYSQNGTSVRDFDCTTELSLYPYWVLNSYSVAFDANGGTGSMVDQTFSVGETKALTKNGLSRKGYTFQGWATTADGSVKYSNGASVSNLSYVDGEKITLYAVWKRNVYEQVRCGFITSTFTGATSLNTSDIWNNSSQYTETASGIYVTSLAEKTTIAYGTHMLMEKGVTYDFKGCYDDWVGVKVEGSWIAKNTTECKACSGSYTATYSGWHKVEFRVANNGGVGGCQNSSEYGIKWKTSSESTWHDVDATTYWPMFSVAPPVVVSNAADSETPVSSVDGTAYVHLAKMDEAPDCVIKIDGENFITSESLYDVGIWQPRTLGTHTITWISGGRTATLSVDVTSLAFPTTPEPDPPSDEDANIALKTTSKAFGKAGGSGTIGTSGNGTCAVSASDDWITIPAAMASRNAGLAIAYTVAASTEAEERTGYIYVSGHVFTVTQSGVGAELDAYEAACEQDGGSGTVTVIVDSQTGWIARSNVDWISVTTTSGTGETEIEYTVAPWHGVSTRSGTISVGGQTFTVNQTGRRMKLSADGLEADYLPHAITVAIDALATTDWGIAVDASWLSIVDGGTGKGASSIALAINENPSYQARTATALVGTEACTIRQLGRPTAALSFAISPETTTASVDGANGVVGVTATPDLPWSAKSEVSWLTVMPSFASGAGNGNMIYTASPNSTMSERTGAIVVSPEPASGVASRRHTVTQPAATAMISTDAHTFDAAGESFDVDVTLADVVNWSISENCDWVSISGDLNRVGPGPVTIAASENLTVNPRTATVTIAGHAFVVTQLGREVDVEYTAKTFAAEGMDQTETIEVHPDGNVSWTAYASDPSWIIIWGDENTTSDVDGNVYGTGDATISYMVTDYVGDGKLKQGYIVIGDKTVYITQRGYDCDISPTGATVAGNAGAGSVGVSASIDGVWNAIATEPWIKLVGNYDEVTGGGTVNYTFTDNDTGETRTGKIVIAGEEYTITQTARQMVTVAATVAGEGGTVSGGGTYDLGTSVTLTAVVSDDDHAFVEWEKNGNAISTATSLMVMADVDQEIVAVFEKIKTYVVNGEEVKKGTIVSFAAPAPVVTGGTTQLVCRGTSTYPNKGTSFQVQVAGDIDFDWDLWTTNYWVAVSQTEGGTVSGTTGWVAADAEVTFTATPTAGNSLYRWAGFDGGRGATARPSVTVCVSRPMTVSAVFGTFADTLATAADAPSLTFTTGGDAVWTPVIDATAQTGYSSARSGAIGPESESWLETTVSGAGTLAFRWKTDCEHDDGGGATWDRLAIFVNGVEKARLDGTTEWQTVELPLTDAQSVVRWSFYRDDYDDSEVAHENCGWIDGVEVKQ